MRIRVVIQSRLNSSRLPGKALMTLAGYPLIELVARRACRPLPDGTTYEVVVATSSETYDGLIAAVLTAAGIPVFQGDLDDVLGRFVLATSDLDPDDLVVRLTGDNPMADSLLVEELIVACKAEGAEYGRVDIDVVPEGLGAEVFPVRLLREANAQSSDPYDHEHVTPWIRRHTNELLFSPKANPVREPEDVNGYRATVDCLDDFDRVSRAFAGLPDPVDVPWSVVLGRLVEQTPQLSTEVDVDPRRSQLVLGLAELESSEEARTSARLAVRSGFSHALTHVDGLKNWLAAVEPALKMRLKLYFLAEHPGDLRHALETLTHAHVDAVLIPAQREQDWTEIRSSSVPVGEWGLWVQDEDDWDVAIAAAPPIIYAGSPPNAEQSLDLVTCQSVVIGPGAFTEDGSLIAHPSFDQVVIDRFGL